MCGRYTFRTHPKFVALEFEDTDLPLFTPRYNICPTQQVAALRVHDGKPEVAMLRWGLIPSWATDLKKLPLLINAVGETAATKPSFRAAFKRRRCLVLADGYYEWQKAGKQKLPWYYTLQDESAFAFAGLWERWDHGATPVESCTILTTDANELASAVHNRMPAMLTAEGRRLWLDPEFDAEALQQLLKPYPASEMRVRPVATHVNKAGFEGAECIANVG